jgi:hypothetical protein
MNYKSILFISLVISFAYAGIDTSDAKDAWADYSKDNDSWVSEDWDDFDTCVSKCDCDSDC